MIRKWMDGIALSSSTCAPNTVKLSNRRIGSLKDDRRQGTV